MSLINKEDKLLKMSIKEGVENGFYLLKEPPECFYELYRENIDKTSLINEWNTLIRYKYNTPDLLEQEINNYLAFEKSIIGRNLNDSLIAEIDYRIDLMTQLGIERDIWISAENFEYSSAKNQIKNAFYKYKQTLNTGTTVLWDVRDIQKYYRHAFVDPRDAKRKHVKKRDVIKALDRLKKLQVIYEYEKNDIYCGPPVYKKKKYFDYEFGWDYYYEKIDPEKAEGNSFQKRKKKFHVCLYDNIENHWVEEYHHWDIKQEDWEKEYL